jgi:hypothetical protein
MNGRGEDRENTTLPSPRKGKGVGLPTSAPQSRKREGLTRADNQAPPRDPLPTPEEHLQRESAAFAGRVGTRWPRRSLLRVRERGGSSEDFGGRHRVV